MTEHARTPQSLLLGEEDLALQTDLYQLTMMAAYFTRGMLEDATFELWVRRLPESRAFLLVAGLEQALAYLKSLRFRPAQIEWLRAHEAFAHVPGEFFDYLAEVRFTGDVHAMLEGEVAFAGEPLLRVTAPLPVAQLVETFLLAVINYQTLVASKAARLRIAAGDRPVVDFGMRRGHGPQAGLLAARASWIAGLDGTSDVEAGRRLGIPVAGTMAHSYVLSFESEEEAFAHFAELFPDRCVLLVDTHDTLEGCRRAIDLNRPFRGVRLDSGDLLELSRRCRLMLDEAGRHDVRIFASGDLEEHRIAELLEAGAPIDAFGVGTELVTSRDAPALAAIYKLVELVRGGRLVGVAKHSPGKGTRPGAKQVWRTFDAAGRLREDVVRPAAHPAPRPDAEPLLQTVMRGGEPVDPGGILDLGAARTRAADRLARLPEDLRRLRGAAHAPVRFEGFPQG